MSVRCVVFDIDDTLYLERDYVRSGFLAVGRAVSGEPGPNLFATTAWSCFEEGSRGRIFDEVLARLGWTGSPELIARLVSTYREHRPGIVLLPDAQECLEALLDAGVALAAVTDGPLASQRAKAAALNLERWLTPIVFTATFGPGFGKPHPEPFREVERFHGVGGADCVYVADNPAKDFLGPRQLGWRTVRVRRVGSLHEHVPSAGDVDQEIGDLRTLCDLLESR